MSYSDPFGLFAMDVTVEGEQSKAIVAYLRSTSETFRKTYDALDADHSVHLTIRDAVGDEKDMYPSQFTPGAGGQGLILFNDVNLNQQNTDLPKGSKFIFTAASVMGHELGHAAGHWSKTTGVSPSCGGNHPGSTSCSLRFENKVRSELPAAERGGTRDKY